MSKLASRFLLSGIWLESIAGDGKLGRLFLKWSETNGGISRSLSLSLVSWKKRLQPVFIFTTTLGIFCSASFSFGAIPFDVISSDVIQRSDQDQTQNPRRLRVMSYNVQNLFDTQLDYPQYDDREFTPDGKQVWVPTVLNDKIRNLADVILDSSPDVIALTEVESERALLDLYQAGFAQKGFVSWTLSPTEDRRGIRGALISRFPVAPGGVKSHRVGREVRQDTEQGERIGAYVTRDILEVTYDSSSRFGPGSKFTVLVNHWPSRISPTSEERRFQIAQLMQKIVKDIVSEDPSRTVIVTGDFNDDIHDRSLRSGLKKTYTPDGLYKTSPGTLYITTYEKSKEPISERGTYYYRGQWIGLDHIMVAKGRAASRREQSAFHFVPGSFQVLRHRFLDRRGVPVGCQMPRSQPERCADGASDHLPILADFEYR